MLNYLSLKVYQAPIFVFKIQQQQEKLQNSFEVSREPVKELKINFRDFRKAFRGLR